MALLWFQKDASGTNSLCSGFKFLWRVSPSEAMVPGSFDEWSWLDGDSSMSPKQRFEWIESSWPVCGEAVSAMPIRSSSPTGKNHMDDDWFTVCALELFGILRESWSIGMLITVNSPGLISLSIIHGEQIISLQSIPTLSISQFAFLSDHNPLPSGWVRWSSVTWSSKFRWPFDCPIDTFWLNELQECYKILLHISAGSLISFADRNQRSHAWDRFPFLLSNSCRSRHLVWAWNSRRYFSGGPVKSKSFSSDLLGDDVLFDGFHLHETSKVTTDTQITSGQTKYIACWAEWSASSGSVRLKQSSTHSRSEHMVQIDLNTWIIQSDHYGTDYKREAEISGMSDCIYPYRGIYLCFHAHRTILATYDKTYRFTPISRWITLPENNMTISKRILHVINHHFT
jgi:hypothetical protein